MKMNMISPFHNYDNGYIGLVNLDMESLPSKLLVYGHTLLKKSEFHISLICVKRVAALIDKNNSEIIEEEIINEFKKFINIYPLKEFKILPEFRLVKRDNRVTVVVMTEVEYLKQFFNDLRKKYKTTIPDQPTHITIYTLQPEKGVGIFSKKELNMDSEIVEIAELKKLLKYK